MAPPFVMRLEVFQYFLDYHFNLGNISDLKMHNHKIIIFDHIIKKLASEYLMFAKVLIKEVNK